MGKTFSTGLLTDGISQDSSNNIGIGVAPSGTNKFEVSGSTKLNGNTAITGSLTVSSSANAIILPAGQTIGLGTAQIYTGTGGNSGNIFIQGAQTKLYADKVVLEAATAAGVEVIGGTKLSGSFIVSGSATTIGATTLSGSLSVSGSITSTSTITAQTLVVQTITSSVLYSSGSNVFGNSLSNTQVMTGSVGITGSLSVNGTGAFSNTLDIALNVGNSQNGLNLVNNAGSGYGNSLNFYQSATKTAQIFSESSVDNTSEMSFRTMVGSTLATRMFISPSGSVGIGTTNPTGKLMLYQSSAGNVFQNIVSNQGSSTQAGINFSPSMTDTEVAANPAQASIYATDSNYGANIIFATKATGAVGNALTTRLTIASTGAATFSSRVNVNNAPDDADIAMVVKAPSGSNKFIFFGRDASDVATFKVTSAGAATFASSVALGQSIEVVSTNGILYHSTNNNLYLQGGSDGLIMYSDGSRSNANIYLNNASQSVSISTAGTDRMRINSVGEIGIGGTPEGTIKLKVVGTNTGSNDYTYFARNSAGTGLFSIRNDGVGFLLAASWAYGSDRRLKENINYIQTGLDKVLALKPATFDYIDGVKNNIGWIAQDVQEVIPEAVGTISETNDQLTLKSDFIVPYLVKAIQELSAKNESLQSQINELKNN